MKNIIILLTALWTVLTLSCCKKDEPKPEPDPNVADHMTAIINGQKWEAHCESSWPGLGCRKVDCQYYKDTRGFEIAAAGNGYVLNFSKSGGSGGVVLGLNSLPYRKGVLTCASNHCNFDNCRQYEIDSTFSNILEVLTIDNTLKIIEGKFELRVVNNQCNDTIRIENGYFKTNYRP